VSNNSKTHPGFFPLVPKSEDNDPHPTFFGVEIPEKPSIVSSSSVYVIALMHGGMTVAYMYRTELGWMQSEEGTYPTRYQEEDVKQAKKDFKSALRFFAKNKAELKPITHIDLFHIETVVSTVPRSKP
jgi:hypothetical protein